MFFDNNSGCNRCCRSVNTTATINIPYGAAVGTHFIQEFHDLEQIIPDNSQLLLGFYNTSSATAGLDMYFGGIAKIVK